MGNTGGTGNMEATGDAGHNLELMNLIVEAKRIREQC
jgi:hypothetical protein